MNETDEIVTWCINTMENVTRENARQVLESMSEDRRTFFEWWFTGRYGDKLAKPGRYYIAFGNYKLSDHAENVDLQSAYGAMHRAILDSREPL